MKNILNITDRDIQKYSERHLDVYEKLDMVYFKIKVNCVGYVILNAKGKEITKVDVIINSVYRDISSFAEEFDHLSAYAEYGEFSAGFFYLPVSKTKTIEYNNMEAGTFILSDYYTEDKHHRNDSVFSLFVPKRFKFIAGWNGKIGPYIGSVKLGDWFDKYDDQVSIIHYMFNEMGVVKSVSGNEISDIEGVILRDGSKSYEILMNDTFPNIEASSKLIYRDTLLESFIHTVSHETLDVILSSGKDYVGKMCDLFLEYVNTTNFFNNMWFEEDDFVPPVEGYVGEIAYDLLPQIVSVVCKNNPLYKNVLRILLVTFSGSPYANKFKRFNDEERALLMEILVKANTK